MHDTLKWAALSPALGFRCNWKKGVSWPRNCMQRWQSEGESLRAEVTLINRPPSQLWASHQHFAESTGSLCWTTEQSHNLNTLKQGWGGWASSSALCRRRMSKSNSKTLASSSLLEHISLKFVLSIYTAHSWNSSFYIFLQIDFSFYCFMFSVVNLAYACTYFGGITGSFSQSQGSL